jgi:hypothetical protein
MATVWENFVVSGSGCACCHTQIACTGMEGRIRGGTGTLCGHSEYSSPSTPAKKYRVQTYNEDFISCIAYTSPNCGGTLVSNRDRMTGATSTYSATDCSKTQANTARTINGQNGRGTTCPQATAASSTTDHPGYQDLDYSTGINFSGFVRSIDLPAQIEWEPSGSCFISGNGLTISSGTKSVALSVEDTEANAITRLLAGAGGTWSAWLASGGVGCTGTPPTCLLARWEQRTSGFTFVYQEAEYRLQYTGLTPSQGYAVEVKYYRRVFGSGSYTLYYSEFQIGAADGSGNLTLTGTVPNDVGYETYASC